MNTAIPLKKVKEINAMKNALHGRNKLLFILAVNIGLRISDILKLKVGDVRDKDYIVVKEEKTDKTRTSKLNQSIKDAVAELIPHTSSDSEYLFQSRKGDNKPITRIQAFRILNEAAKRAGIPHNISCHSLRKTFGFMAYENGTDITLLMRIFNHSSAATTLRYIGIEQQDIDAVYDSLNL